MFITEHRQLDFHQDLLQPSSDRKLLLCWPVNVLLHTLLCNAGIFPAKRVFGGTAAAAEMDALCGLTVVLPSLSCLQQLQQLSLTCRNGPCIPPSNTRRLCSS
jgi:hypothetical protein